MYPNAISVDEAITEMQNGRPVEVGTLGGKTYPVTRIQKSFGQIAPEKLYVQYKKNGWAQDAIADAANFIFLKGGRRSLTNS